MPGMQKKLLIVFISTALLIFSAEIILASGNKSWNIPELNTAYHVNYLTDNEKAVVLEINKLRTNPAAYAEEYLVPMLNMYKGKILYMPGNDPILTKEGVVALREAIRDLKNSKPVHPLLPDIRLTKASRDHQQEQSRTGQIGHRGSNGSRISDRIERHGNWDKRISENIFYGDPDARSVVLHLVIDDGVPGRGHRINFLDPELRLVGVSCGTHKVYRYMCVMNFAAGFRQTNTAKQ
jgi:uncharacterized protein YkwD